MRTLAIFVLALAVAGCSSGGSASSGASSGTTSNGASGTSGNGGTSGSGATSSTSTSTSSSSSTGSSGTSGAIGVTLTSPDAGGCYDIHVSPVINLTATGFTFTNGGCPNGGPCGLALLKLTGPTGSCDANGTTPNSGMGTPPVQLNENFCPPVAGPNGPRAPSGAYTVAVYLLDESGQQGVLLTAPDGGPFATESFTQSYGEGFQCGADPEVVLTRPISRRLDGLAIQGNQILIAENAGGNGALVTIPEAIQAADAGVQVLFALTDGGSFWPTDVASDGTHAFADENNGGDDVWSVPIGGGSATNQGQGNALASGPLGTYWNGIGGLWFAPTGQAGALWASGGGVGAIAADDTGVYVIGNTGIEVVPLGGGASQTLVASINGENPVGIAVDAQNVYWTANAQLGGAQSKIRSAPKSGGDGGSQIVVDNLVLPAALIADSSGPGGTALYFASNQVSISRFTTDDGGLQQLPYSYTGHTGSAQHWFAVDGPYLYWTDDSHVFRVLK
ncbi:MAG: hypothetical protein JST54_14620 [Deltaproteobacteria bacterium]|nr:hypothetical protein [Deltaproteobacteria bacterium]